MIKERYSFQTQNYRVTCICLGETKETFAAENIGILIDALDPTNPIRLDVLLSPRPTSTHLKMFIDIKKQYIRINEVERLCKSLKTVPLEMKEIKLGIEERLPGIIVQIDEENN